MEQENQEMEPEAVPMEQENVEVKEEAADDNEAPKKTKGGDEQEEPMEEAKEEVHLVV